MIARDGHRPGLVAGMETGQETCRVVDILAGVEHVVDAAEMRGVVVMIDLHAAEIDQRLALAAGVGEGGKCLGSAFREDCFSFYVQSVRLKAAFLAGLCQANRVEDAGGYAVAVGGTQDLGLAGIGGGSGAARKAR